MTYVTRARRKYGREARFQFERGVAEDVPSSIGIQKWSAMPPWDRYQDRYNERPETFDAYVDVWSRVPEAQSSFGGWVAFAQAASAEPSWVKNRLERVLDAERIMYAAGYEIGSPTQRGARRWVPIERTPLLGTLRFFGLKISV